ncbi:MAG: M18 family aminopeptidase [Sphingomonadales bacterium]
MSILDYIDASPSPYHAVAETVAKLESTGFMGLSEAGPWNMEPGKSYYTTRGGRTVLAWRMGMTAPNESGVRILGAHTDSPVLKIRPNPDLKGRDMSLLTTEVYGGPLLYTWLDRDLKLSGAVYLKGDKGPDVRLVDLNDMRFRVNSLAIHLRQEKGSDTHKINRHKDLPLMFSGPVGSSKAAMLDVLAQHVGAKPDDILEIDLRLADHMPSAYAGKDEEFISAPRLDNLFSCYTALEAFLAAPKEPRSTQFICFYDAEEIGSLTWAGARSDGFTAALNRIAHSYGLSADEEAQARARSIFISADMAHAEHVSFKDATDSEHVPDLNGGLALKSAARGNYAIGYPAAAWFRQVCGEAGVPLQSFMYRCDHGAGSSIGPLVTTGSGICGIDVGAPLLAMHSIRELAGTRDVALCIDAYKAFFASELPFEG